MGEFGGRWPCRRHKVTKIGADKLPRRGGAKFVLLGFRVGENALRLFDCGSIRA